MTWIVYLLAAFACAGVAFCVGFLAAFLGERWALRRASRRKRTTINVIQGTELRYRIGDVLPIGEDELYLVVGQAPGRIDVERIERRPL